MIHAVTLVLVLVYAAWLAAAAPMAVLTAILLVVAWNMGEWREIPELGRHGWTNRLVWLVTFALTGPCRPDRSPDGRAGLVPRAH